MNILSSFILSILAGLGTVLGSLLAFIPTLKNEANMCLILSFSGSIMLFISIFDLLPNSVFTILNNFNIFYSLLIIISSFLIGVLVIKLLNNRIEEGSSLKKIGILSFISLMIHNFPEGIITFMSSLLNFKLGIKLSFAILLHNIPEGICISLPYSSTHSPIKGVGLSLLSALAEPLGALIAFLFLKNIINNIIISIILIFVSGIMIDLSIDNIFKYSLSFKNKKYFVRGVLFAFLYVVITLII